jgi:hypothetical protein
MSLRGLIALGAAVVVLVLIAQLGQRDDAPGAGEQGMPFLPALEDALDDIERVTVLTAGEMPAATLERRADEWVVAEKSGYRADVGKLRAGLRALSEARILEPKTANPELHSRLGVENLADEMASGTGVAFTLTGGGSVPTVILGNTEGTKYRYVRRADEAQSYLIDRDPEMPRTASQWLDAAILDVRGDRVQQVTIKHPDETVTISKMTRADPNFAVANVPEGRELLYAGVANVVGNALRELKLEDVAAAAEPVADAEPVVVEFRTFDGLIVTARGTQDGDDSWLTFEAAYDAEQAAQFAAAPPKDEADDAAPAADNSEPAADDVADGAAGAERAAAQTAADVMAEVERINERTSGWRYRIASYQYDQLTRRMSDLLKPPPSDDDADE